MPQSLFFSNSFKIAFNLSSNSHLYLAQASKAHISRVTILFPFRLSGTSLFAIFKAIPSTIAVLPTQGSQIKTGLFFVFLLSIAINLFISISLPITLSNLFSLASFVKSSEKKSKIGVSDSSCFLLLCFLFESNGVVEFHQNHSNKF